MCSAVVDFAPVLGGVLTFPTRRGHSHVRKGVLIRRAWGAAYREAANRLIHDVFAGCVFAPKVPHYVKKGTKERTGRHDGYLRLIDPLGGPDLVIGLGALYLAPKYWRHFYGTVKRCWDVFPGAVRKRLASYGLNRCSFAMCVLDLAYNCHEEAYKHSRKCLPLVVTLDFSIGERMDNGRPFPPIVYAEDLESCRNKWKLLDFRAEDASQWRGHRAPWSKR